MYTAARTLMNKVLESSQKEVKKLMDAYDSKHPDQDNQSLREKVLQNKMMCFGFIWVYQSLFSRDDVNLIKPLKNIKVFRAKRGVDQVIKKFYVKNTNGSERFGEHQLELVGFKEHNSNVWLYLTKFHLPSKTNPYQWVTTSKNIKFIQKTYESLMGSLSHELMHSWDEYKEKDQNEPYMDHESGDEAWTSFVFPFINKDFNVYYIEPQEMRAVFQNTYTIWRRNKDLTFVDAFEKQVGSYSSFRELLDYFDRILKDIDDNSFSELAFRIYQWYGFLPSNEGFAKILEKESDEISTQEYLGWKERHKGLINIVVKGCDNIIKAARSLLKDYEEDELMEAMKLARKRGSKTKDELAMKMVSWRNHLKNVRAYTNEDLFKNFVSTPNFVNDFKRIFI